MIRPRAALFLMLALIPAISWAQAKCAAPTQPYGERCVSARMADYISCIEASGGNREELLLEVNQAGGKSAGGALSASAAGPVIRGGGSITLNTASENALAKRLQQRWFGNAMAACASILDVPKPAPTKPANTDAKTAARLETEISQRLRSARMKADGGLLMHYSKVGFVQEIVVGKPMANEALYEDFKSRPMRSLLVELRPIAPAAHKAAVEKALEWVDEMIRSSQTEQKVDPEFLSEISASIGRLLQERAWSK
jgi:hypothetical protein